MAILGKNAILSAEDFEYALVSCPEWGGDVRVRGLSAADQAYVAKLTNQDKKEILTLTVFIRGVVGEDGERLFSASDMDDLKGRSYAVIERVAKKIVELTSKGDADAVEALRKN